MGQKLMNANWIKDLAIKERERRRNIELFVEASKQSAPQIKAFLESKATEFEIEFPAEKVSVTQTQDGSLVVRRTSHTADGGAGAFVQFNAVESTITCTYDGDAAGYRSWHWALTVMVNELHYGNRALSYEHEQLALKILGPVLFPALKL